MSLEKLMIEIGDDTDLLTRSDEWLEEERKSIAAKFDEIARELRSVITAQKIKMHLQQRNLVAVQSLSRDTSGQVYNTSVNIMNLPDAVYLLKNQNNDDLDKVNYLGHISGWESDGYDIETSSELR
jgi:hypothetical protein